MNELELSKYISKIDPVDILIRVKEAKKFLDEHKVDDALAYAIAAGVRLGIKAVLDSPKIRNYHPIHD